jgi:hypothetical protein
MVREIGSSRRYEPVPVGLRAMTALVIIREKVIKPLLAAASTTGSQKEHSVVKLFSWEHASPRQARKRDVSRHIWRAWQQPRDMRTGRSR